MNEFESDWISLSQRFVQNGWMQDGRIQDGHHHQVESEWMSEVFFVQNGWMQDGRIQDGCHHQVEWEWMSLSQIKLVWFRVRLEWECFWVNLRDDNKVSESMMPCVWIQHGRIQDGCHHQFESEWMSEVYFVQNGWIQVGRFQDGCHHQVESEWMSEVFLCKWWGGKCE